MSTYNLLPMGKAQFCNSLGVLAGGYVYTATAGTGAGPGQSSPGTTYSDSAGLVPNSNPIALDLNGQASIWTSVPVDVAVYDGVGIFPGTLVYTASNVGMSFPVTSSSAYSAWNPQTQFTGVTYIGATQFSVLGDQSSLFPKGTRVRATVTAGYVYGTVVGWSLGGAPTATTVTVLWDYGMTLDNSLTVISLSVIPISNNAIPTIPVTIETGNYTMTLADANTTVISNVPYGTSPTTTFYLPGSYISGETIKILNINTSVLTVSGVVSGVSNPTLNQYDILEVTWTGYQWIGAVQSIAVYSRPTPRNLIISVTSTTQLTISADEVTLQAPSGRNYVAKNVSVAITSTNSGVVNGMDTGSPAGSTWYSVWVISDGTNVAGLISTSATSPATIGAYIYKSRVGWVRTDASGNAYLLFTKQKGNKAQYIITKTSNTTTMPIMSYGIQGTYDESDPTWSAVAVGAFVPTTASEIIMSLNNQFTAGSVAYFGVAPNNQYLGVNSAAVPPVSATMNPQLSMSFSMVLESSNVYWYSSTASGELLCLGWVDNL